MSVTAVRETVEPGTGRTTNAASASRLEVCLVSPVSCQATGGTAAYIRALGETLAASEATTAYGIARSTGNNAFTTNYDLSEQPAELKTEGGFITRLIAPPAPVRYLLKPLPRLMGRPALQPLAVKGFEQAFRASLSQAMTPQTNVIHYVGTGWELLGHAALAEARRRDAVVAVTPFLHPHEWGDSPHDMAFYDRCDAVMAASEHEAACLRERGVHPERVHRINLAPVAGPSGDGERFRARHGLGNRPLVLFIARKQRYKGYHTLCESLQQVCAAVPDVCLVAAGPDTEAPFPAVPSGALLDLGELQWNEADQQHKADALAACDIFCMPSAAEAFGIVYVEAWAYGKPVVGGTAPAVRELVARHEGGLCVEQNPAAVAEALIHLLTDYEARERMGRAGKEAQERLYNWGAVGQAHRDIYAECLQRRASLKGATTA